MAGISKTKGVELVMQFQKSVNTDKFIEYLKQIRYRNPFDRIAIFMDRLSVHTCRRSKEKMAFLKIEAVYNASYSPEFNPIETVFSLVKRNIKTERLKLIIKNEEEDLNTMTTNEFNQIKKDTCVNLIRNSSNKLK